MFKKISIIFFLILLLSKNTFSGELNSEVYWEGLKSSFTLMANSSVEQFKEKNNAYALLIATPFLYYSFKEDDRISKNARTKKIPKSMQIASDLSPLFGLPLLSFATFSVGIKNDDEKLVQFGKEYFAALYLAFIESAAMSLIPVHDRPETSKLAEIESKLRGASSFPSGHVIPYATLALKTFQFYGPYMAIIPTSLMVMTSIQRVRDGKHYLSDVIGGFFLSVFASEGVRKMANYQSNNSTYKFLFEHDMSIGIMQYENVLAPKITINW